MRSGNKGKWSFKVIDSLEKVFYDCEPARRATSRSFSAWLGERLSFQVSCRLWLGGMEASPAAAVRFRVLGDLAEYASLESVESVWCERVAPESADDSYLRRGSGLYPDVLWPMPEGVVSIIPGQWRSVWVSVLCDDESQVGRHCLRVTAELAGGSECLFDGIVEISILASRLPELNIVNTHWLHWDALADYYGCEVFSEKHWHILERFVASAQGISANSLLTPTWTPPLDTAIGERRRPVQLVEVSDVNGNYVFGFRQLKRWLEMCRRYGMQYIEVAHLFTQWGAKATPAIYVNVGGTLEQRFGWHVPATDPSYREFLGMLVPQLRQVFADEWDNARVIYHLSDEPEGEDKIRSYKESRAVVQDLLSGCRVMDATGDPRAYSERIVDHPIVATDVVGKFLDLGLKDLWVYYCGAQHYKVANRLIAQPSARNRVLGWQLFKYDVRGFLHWGFNFYYSRLARSLIEPYEDASAGTGFLAGDQFLVYPGADGSAVESIRARVFAEALADYRAMCALEAVSSKEEVLKIIDPTGELSFEEFSCDPAAFAEKRAAINAGVFDIRAWNE